MKCAGEVYSLAIFMIWDILTENESGQETNKHAL